MPACMGRRPGNSTKLSRSCISASTTLRIARQTVFLLKFSASPTLYIKVPVAKYRNATHTVCGTVSARLRLVAFATYAPDQVSRSAYVTMAIYPDNKWSTVVVQKTLGWTWSYLANAKSCFVVQAPGGFAAWPPIMLEQQANICFLCNCNCHLNKL